MKLSKRVIKALWHLIAREDGKLDAQDIFILFGIMMGVKVIYLYLFNDKLDMEAMILATSLALSSSGVKALINK